MSDVLTRLQEEHRNIAKLLNALEHQLAVFDAMERPDFDVLAGIADYFIGFPDRCHHPKEDLVYRKMSEKDAEFSRTLANLIADHESISAQAEHFRQAVQNVLQEVEVSRSAFDEVAREFLRNQRRHMQVEEEQIFPLAMKILDADDWAEIEKEIVQEEDPVFGAKTLQEFATLRDNILRWDAEDQSG